jgi:hypothetical protein
LRSLTFLKLYNTYPPNARSATLKIRTVVENAGSEEFSKIKAPPFCIAGAVAAVAAVAAAAVAVAPGK